MKKFLKNAVLIMLVSCFIFNIVNLLWMYVEHCKVVQEIMDIAKQRNEEIITMEEGYELLASVYSAGFGNKVAIEAGIIVISLVLGITIGMIITFEEKSKLRVVIIYILGLFITTLVPTMREVIYYMSFETFFDDIIYYLDNTWKWYTLAFFIIYTIKIYINNKKTKELNKVLRENRNKTI